MSHHLWLWVDRLSELEQLLAFSLVKVWLCETEAFAPMHPSLPNWITSESPIQVRGKRSPIWGWRLLQQLFNRACWESLNRCAAIVLDSYRQQTILISVDLGPKSAQSFPHGPLRVSWSALVETRLFAIWWLSLRWQPLVRFAELIPWDDRMMTM